jgi:hypothetical protein
VRIKMMKNYFYIFLSSCMNLRMMTGCTWMNWRARKKWKRKECFLCDPYQMISVSLFRHLILKMERRKKMLLGMEIMKERLHWTVTNRVSFLWKFESYGNGNLWLKRVFMDLFGRILNNSSDLPHFWWGRS